MHEPERFFEAFRGRLAGGDVLQNVRNGVIGKDVMVDGPFGPKPMLYADYVASGRALRQIEETILEEVLPYYANSHTEGSFCGARMTGLRRAARAEVAHLCGAREEHAVIFTGAGATAGINRLMHLLGVWEAIAAGRGATVLTGPYEHHSNILPWRESGAKVIEIAEAADGGPDLDMLDDALAGARGLVIGAFSAASNVTGILTDVAEVTRRLKAAGALAVWDYAGGAPYLPVTMMPAPDAPVDALVISPHKFVGGPGTSGILIVRKDAVRTDVPTLPGGGSVRYVSSDAHDYTLDIAEREEAGTPNVIGDIRAALALIVKDVIGQDRIDAFNRQTSQRMLAEMARLPRVKVLGNLDCTRLPIFSFTLTDGSGGPVSPHYATRFLSDYFGIQARGGCACAGPYGHRLLEIDDANSARIRAEILAGNTAERPGFVRFNLSYLFTGAEVDRVRDALGQLAELADQYRDFYREGSGAVRSAAC